MWKLIEYLLYLCIIQYFVKFHIALKSSQKDLTDRLFADLVLHGARAIHNATRFLLDECGPDQRGANIQGFGNFGEVNVLTGNFNVNKFARADTCKSNYIALIDAPTDDKNPPE